MGMARTLRTSRATGASRTAGASRTSRVTRASRAEASSVRTAHETGSAILGVPSRLMAPRLILISAVAILLVFGMVMIYSASSVTALVAEGDAGYYFIRQAIFAVVGLVAAVIIALMDYHFICKYLLPFVWVATVILLGIVLFVGAGSETNGASRWLLLGPFTLQPSEFAKITLVLTGANIMSSYFVEHTISFKFAVGLSVVAIALPLLLIVAQPDKGSTLVILTALMVMIILAGIEMKWILGMLLLGALFIMFLIIKDPYSLSRVSAMLNPFEDLYGEGWQLAQGYYAFGSGGILGVGLGMSRQKYYYLPFAYNDFIFAVIGEELGLLGTVMLVLLFGVLAWAGYRIARYAPDLTGRLIAMGCTSILWIQMLINVCGVIGIIPSSGKPIPFVSYGGSSVIASLMLMGFVVSVSRRSQLPTTVYDDLRGQLRVTSSRDADLRFDESTAGEPTRRSERGSRGSQSLTLVSGGVRSASSGRVSSRRSTSYERIDLGPTPAERLRGRGKRDR